MISRCIISLIIFLSLSFGQSNSSDDVRLFQNFFMDAPITDVTYGEGGLQYESYDFGNSFTLGVQGGYPITICQTDRQNHNTRDIFLSS